MGGAGVKRKKLKECKKDGDDQDHIDDNLVLNIHKLQDIQDELEKINEEVSDKVLEIEQKYSEIRKPLYERRNDVIKLIPDFWLTAFLSHPALSALLTVEEHKIFQYFTSLEVKNFKDMKMGYTFSFLFQPNPFFEETLLTKTFIYLEDDIDAVKSTPITWKLGMRSQNGATERKRNKRPLKDEGFFAWFASDKKDDLPDDVADIIKEDLWPNPLSYFNTECEGEELSENGEDVAEEASESENEF